MNKKNILKVIPIIIMFCIISTNVLGFGNGFSPNAIPGGVVVNEIKSPVQKAWGTISLILQVCAVGGIIFTGVRYMFAGPDAKGEMKKTLPFLIVGLVIVFASTFIIDFIVKIVEDVI